MKYLALLIALGLAGCDKPMTNDEIITEVNKCQAAGMSYYEWADGIGLKTTQIICTRKKQ